MKTAKGNIIDLSANEGIEHEKENQWVAEKKKNLFYNAGSPAGNLMTTT